MKKIVIASDSFKGTISSSEICDIAGRVIPEVFPDCDIVTIPVADGGEGTVDCFIRAAGAIPVTVVVPGPLFDDTPAVYAVMGDTAVIEMSAASGLPLISDRKDPLRASTYGTGMLIKHAVEHGCTSVLLGLGGSATNDGGCGMAAALGVKFIDSAGSSFIPDGGTLKDIVYADTSACDAFLSGIRITAMCDVNNPLYGERGAARIYGPQKGADEKEIGIIDSGLARLACVMKMQREALLPGAGAAGGMGFGVMAFLHGELRSGTEAILDAVDFDGALENADLIITGEGKLDSQSLQGKLLSGISSRALKSGVPMIAIVGKIDGSADALYSQGLTAVFQTNRAGLPFEQLTGRAARDYEDTLRDVMYLIKAAE